MFDVISYLPKKTQGKFFRISVITTKFHNTIGLGNLILGFYFSNNLRQEAMCTGCN